MNQELLAQGVVYLDMESAVKEYEDIVKKYFEKLIHSSDHKFSALHYAVWSGGSFVYVPKNTKVEMPLQSYFRLNAREAGQFEHTLIILEKGADLHFIEGCSAPKYKKNVLHAGAVELYVSEGARHVLDMRCMFSKTQILAKGVTNLSRWNTRKVLDMSYMFDNCSVSSSGVEFPDISRWKTSNVTNMESMFAEFSRR